MAVKNLRALDVGKKALPTKPKSLNCVALTTKITNNRSLETSSIDTLETTNRVWKQSYLASVLATKLSSMQVF